MRICYFELSFFSELVAEQINVRCAVVHSSVVHIMLEVITVSDTTHYPKLPLPAHKNSQIDRTGVSFCLEFKSAATKPGSAWAKRECNNTIVTIL